MKSVARPFVISLVALWLLVFTGSFGVSAYHQLHARIINTRAPQQKLRVLTIGGSVAHGWKAPKGQGYLQLAFKQLSDNTPADYKLYDQTIVGANGTQLSTLYKGKYPSWLSAIHPDIVVISWGLLNDAHPKTPVSTFDAKIKEEIQLALNAHAMVFVVTPPVTKASYTQYRKQEPLYAKGEIQTAESFHNPNVYVFHLFSEMKQYLAVHHQSYVQYMGDGWHPNAAGHRLAGQLLYNDMLQQFDSQRIGFKRVSA